MIVYEAYETYYEVFAKELKEIYPNVNLIIIQGFQIERILDPQNFQLES